MAPSAKSRETRALVHLVADLGAHSTALGPGRRVDQGAIPHHADERSTETPAREELVHRIQVEQVAEPRRQRLPAGDQRSHAPRPGQLVWHLDTSREGPERLLLRALSRRPFRRHAQAASVTRAAVRAAVVLARSATGAAVRGTVRPTVRAAVGTTVVLARSATGAAVRRTVRPTVRAAIGTTVMLARIAGRAAIGGAVLLLRHFVSFRGHRNPYVPPRRPLVNATGSSPTRGDAKGLREARVPLARLGVPRGVPHSSSLGLPAGFPFGRTMVFNHGVAGRTGE